MSQKKRKRNVDIVDNIDIIDITVIIDFYYRYSAIIFTIDNIDVCCNIDIFKIYR